MKVFVPITDEMLERMDGSEIPVPYQVGVQLRTTLTEAPVGALEITSLEDEFQAGRPAEAQARRQGRH